MLFVNFVVTFIIYIINPRPEIVEYERGFINNKTTLLLLMKLNAVIHSEVILAFQ